MNESNTQRQPIGLLSDVVVVTGTIGSGKSRVSNGFRQLGAVVVEADALARNVVKPGSPAYLDICQEFGNEILSPGGEIDRARLAAWVFQDRQKRERLEQITHPRIRELAHSSFAAARKLSPPLIVYDCPLFYEGGLHKQKWKRVIVVSAERARCIERIVKRDNLTAAEAERRIDAQLPIEVKAARADIVINNNSTEEALLAKVEQLYTALASTVRPNESAIHSVLEKLPHQE